ncbi:MAG: 2-oxo-4-hydroxy-4-carboxy-5-ureidoimidazoline decarboxylase [Gemmatimonadaceae bacterium]
MTLALAQLNALSRADAERELLACCGSRAWVREVAAARPFADMDSLLGSADDIWWRLSPEDWLEAFSKHPRIGDRASSARPAVERTWSEGEQSGARGAAPAVLADLATANADYESRFGHVFLICATGKSADAILDQVRERLHNDPERELLVAAEEQRRITHLRLRKLLDT